MSAGQHFPVGALYVVGTPIGNAADLSPRAAEVLSRVDVIAAEDTRRTRGLLTSIGAKTPLFAYHEHNESDAGPQLIARLQAGERVALVSDAGMPSISDPGYALVALARSHDIVVMSVPGPCAATAALSIAGLPTDRYVFEGFLPRRDARRNARLRELARESRTLVFYEAVHRMPATLADLALAFGGERRAAVARELTKLFETVYVDSLGALATRVREDIEMRGEFVILVEGAADTVADDAEVTRIYGMLVAELDPKTAVMLTAKLTGRKRNDVYRLARGQ